MLGPRKTPRANIGGVSGGGLRDLTPDLSVAFDEFRPKRIKHTDDVVENKYLTVAGR